MSAAEHPSSNSSQSPKQPVKKPLKRPSLRQPPGRSSTAEESSAAAGKRSPTGTLRAAPSPVADKKPLEIVERRPAAAQPPPPSSPPKPAGQHPISAPSEPMQYRAIGLVRGTYNPSEEQLNRGMLITEDNTEIDSVLLGRITSLIKNHVDLSIAHLWVVYPRTREGSQDGSVSETDLHLQIVGVWEPETLGMPGESPPGDEKTSASEAEGLNLQSQDTESGENAEIVDVPAAASTEGSSEGSDSHPNPEAATASELDSPLPEGTTPARDAESPEPSSPAEISNAPTPAAVAESAPLAEQPDVSLSSENYFSIRGEILKCGEDGDQILVKILQGAKRASDKAPKAFRVHVVGQITGKTVGYFWELDVERRGKLLTLIEGRPIGIVPPKKNKRRKGAPGGFKRKFNRGNGRPTKPGAPQPKVKPRVRPSAPVKSNPL